MTDSSTAPAALSNPASALAPDRAPVATPSPSPAASPAPSPAPAAFAATVAVIVVAAGSGTRLAQRQPKAFVSLSGRTLLEHSLDGVFGMAEPAQVIVVAPSERIAEAQSIALTAAGVAGAAVTVVAGGSTRQLSVAAGIAAVAAGVDTVLVHDCARAFTPSAQFDTVVATVRATGSGAIPGLPVADTIKRTDGDVAGETVDRSTLTAVQTPQGFPRESLATAYASAVEDYTDDAALYAAAGHTVRVVAGDPLAFKITTPWDLRRAETLTAASTEAQPASAHSPQPLPALRTGLGVDVHAYEPSAPLWLGGLYWPDEVGLAGHSDGDAIAHAICDALLSAAGLGDIGGRFGTDDPRFADAHGEVFLRETLALVTGAGYRVHNVAVQVVANTPRMSARRLEIEQNLTLALGAPVSVSATTTDTLGFTGRGEGLTAIATALIGS
jgi:2-C-methyl-D-erythritol 4-phosphate cytidylyltransferase/2-C-methyl-D-erythritol 2,4-cyclodiphosphate synthase